MLSYKIQEAREQQIHASCTVQGQLDFPLELADGEVCSLMGNLWDNALEACRRMTDGEKWIRFRLWIREGKLLLEMENSCTDVEKDGSGNLLTKKTEKKVAWDRPWEDPGHCGAPWRIFPLCCERPGFSGEDYDLFKKSA